MLKSIMSGKTDFIKYVIFNAITMKDIVRTGKGYFNFFTNCFQDGMLNCLRVFNISANAGRYCLPVCNHLLSFIGNIYLATAGGLTASGVGIFLRKYNTQTFHVNECGRCCRSTACTQKNVLQTVNDEN